MFDSVKLSFSFCISAALWSKWVIFFLPHCRWMTVPMMEWAELMAVMHADNMNNILCGWLRVNEVMWILQFLVLCNVCMTLIWYVPEAPILQLFDCWWCLRVSKSQEVCSVFLIHSTRYVCMYWQFGWDYVAICLWWCFCTYGKQLVVKRDVGAKVLWLGWNISYTMFICLWDSLCSVVGVCLF